MIGNRFRRIALATAALAAVVLMGVGTLVVIEAVAHIGGFSPVVFRWPVLARRLEDARLGERWLTVVAVGLCALGAWLLLLSLARRERRRVALALVPAGMVATLDLADARSAAVRAAQSVPAVERATARWTVRKRVRVKVRYHSSDLSPGADVDALVQQRVVAALERLAVQPRRGVKVKRSRRSP